MNLKLCCSFRRCLLVKVIVIRLFHLPNCCSFCLPDMQLLTGTGVATHIWKLVSSTCRVMCQYDCTVLFQMHFLYKFSLQFFLDIFKSVLSSNSNNLSIMSSKLFQVGCFLLTRITSIHVFTASCSRCKTNT